MDAINRSTISSRGNAVPAHARWGRLVILLALFAVTLMEFLVTSANNALADGLTAATEQQIKAAFLINFARFTEWPARKFADTAAPVRVGVLGRNPFGADLEVMARSTRVDDRRVQIERADESRALTGCHIVFISDSELRRLPQVLEA
ncbi:MAG TPA: YfiR family protein, partial [Verrucomicrobiae bacterium]